MFSCLWTVLLLIDHIASPPAIHMGKMHLFRIAAMFHIYNIFAAIKTKNFHHFIADIILIYIMYYYTAHQHIAFNLYSHGLYLIYNIKNITNWYSPMITNFILSITTATGILLVLVKFYDVILLEYLLLVVPSIIVWDSIRS